MCGIFGYIHQNSIPSLSTINTEAILHHRGPDDLGWLLYDGREVKVGKSALPEMRAYVLLLHRRLSIVDLSTAANQPMHCENQRYYILFNGEIYNYLELKTELENKGIQFSTKSDSEVLLKAYIYWGKDCLKKIVGMFAFVIFDRQLNKIIVVRDPFGIKPLYYVRDQQRLLFASEIKTLLAFLPKNKINPERLFFYLRSGMSDFGAETFFSGIKQLQSGHYFEMDLTNFDDIVSQPYWQPTLTINRHITFNQAAEKLRTLFLTNLSLHLRSDVPVAATLSGGIDSSAIVMGIRHLFPNKDIHTFSYVADESNLNEEKWIDAVNVQAKTISHKVFADPTQLITDLEYLIGIQDEPFGSTSIYAQKQVYQAASKASIKVMLDGQGADEMLGGYTFYVAARFASLLKQYKFREALQLLWRTSNPTKNILLRSFHYLLPAIIQKSLRQFTTLKYFPDWLNMTWFSQHEINYLPIKQKYGKDVLQEELLYSLMHSSLPMLLRYEDRNSMAYSIESRVPFLTTELVDFIFSLPEDFVISKDGVSKAIFRQAMQGIVPQVILDRRDKIGFATPEKNWLLILKPWVEKILTSDYAKQLPMLHHKKLLRDWQRMAQGKSSFDFRFWRWINFIKWSELHEVEM